MSGVFPYDDENRLQKCCDNPAYEDSKALDASRLSTSLQRKNMFLTTENTETKTGFPFSILQCRYIVTAVQFCVFFELDCYRIATSISVVAMVNNTAANFKNKLNSTSDSCPLSNLTIAEHSNADAEGSYDWSPEIQGYILSAGFIGYVVSQIPGGLMAECYGAKNTIVGGLFLSSLAHTLCPFAASPSGTLMIVMQFLRGVGQGLLTPANCVLAANWFPRLERGFLNSIILGGYVVGSLITYLASGVMCSSTLLGGWPLVYYVFGGLGLIFSLCAYFLLFESPKEHPRIEKAELIFILENQETDFSKKRPPTPWRKILTSVPVYAMIYSMFSHFWTTTHQISEHPIFLGNILHFSLQENGALNAIPFAIQAVVVFLGGWVSKWLNTNNYVGLTNVRKGCTLLYCVGYSVGLLGVYFAGCDRVSSNISSIIALSFIGLSIPGPMVVPADMSPTFAGSLFGFSNFIASLAAFILPLIVGAMTDGQQTLEQWNKIFLLCIAVIMSSGIIFCLFGSAEVQPWNYATEEDVDTIPPKDKAVTETCKELEHIKEASIYL